MELHRIPRVRHYLLRSRIEDGNCHLGLRVRLHRHADFLSRAGLRSERRKADRHGIIDMLTVILGAVLTYRPVLEAEHRKSHIIRILLPELIAQLLQRAWLPGNSFHIHHSGLERPCAGPVPQLDHSPQRSAGRPHLKDNILVTDYLEQVFNIEVQCSIVRGYLCQVIQISEHYQGIIPLRQCHPEPCLRFHAVQA